MNKLFAENTQLKYDLNRNQKLLNEMKEKECSNQFVIISPMNIQIEQLKTEIQNLQTKNSELKRYEIFVNSLLKYNLKNFILFNEE